MAANRNFTVKLKLEDANRTRVALQEKVARLQEEVAKDPYSRENRERKLEINAHQSIIDTEF
jgi:hypothetical protein